MFWRGVVLAVAAVLLSSCVTERTGFDYAATMQKVGPPGPGQSRIVLLSEKPAGLGLDAAACNVSIDGSPAGLLKPGTYLYADRPAGRHEILATQTLFPGDTKRDVTTESGCTYFLLARASDRANALTGMSIIGGLAGALAASAATSGNQNPGPIDFFPLDESTARTTIAGLQLTD